MKTPEDIINRFINEENVKFNQERDDWMIEAMEEYAKLYHESEVKKLNEPAVIKSVCDNCTAYPFDERGKTPLCKTCKKNPSQTTDSAIAVEHVLADSSFFVREGDYLVVANNFLFCDDPRNKKGFTFKGKLFSPNWINVYEIKNYGGVDCFRVRVHHHMGCDYEGADKIIPVSEFQKQGCRPTEYSKNIDWYVWGGKK